MNMGGAIVSGVAGLGLTIAAVSSAYVVDEGNMAVITNMGKAVKQEGPAGLQWKAPFVTGVREFDVRERALTGSLSAATSNQLSTNLDFSVNWRPNPDAIMEIFVKYGSPEEFATNTIRPRLQQSLKATIGKFTGAELTREREAVATAMLEQARAVLSEYPAEIQSVQIENFSLPERYMEAVLQKEEQREATQKEQLALEQQAIQAKRGVQTAEAEREAAKAKADGQAYATKTTAEADAEAIRLRAEAEADGISAIQEALANNPLLIEYEKAKSWNGQMPSTILGSNQDVLFSLAN